MPQRRSKILASIVLTLLLVPDSDACTSAIIGAHRSSTGQVMLWKHRDSSHHGNFMAHCDRGIGFTALFNEGDTLLAEAWAGLNDAGFAVMNTASYNLAPDTATVKDREGLIMAQALSECRTVASFDSLLRALPHPLGVQANFGAIDSTGAGAYFETCDTGFVRYDLHPDSIIIRTNFSLSGTHGPGKGIHRYRAAHHHLDPCPTVSPSFLTDTVSLSHWPYKTYPKTNTHHCILRPSSTASVVLTPSAIHARIPIK